MGLSKRDIFKCVGLLNNFDFSFALKNAVFKLYMHNVFYLIIMTITVNKLKAWRMPGWYSKRKWKLILTLFNEMVVSLTLISLAYFQSGSKLKEFACFCKQRKLCVVFFFSLLLCILKFVFFFLFWMGRRLLLLFNCLLELWSLRRSRIVASSSWTKTNTRILKKIFLLNMLDRLLTLRRVNSTEKLIIHLICIQYILVICLNFTTTFILLLLFVLLATWAEPVVQTVIVGLHIGEDRSIMWLICIKVISAKLSEMDCWSRGFCSRTILFVVGFRFIFGFIMCSLCS